MDKKKHKISQFLAHFRGWIQAVATILTNIHLPNFFKGEIYRGDAKTVCVPGLNCYSCPAASGACPIGALQAVIGSSKFKFSYYITGFLILLGVLLGRFICGFLCPFGWFQELLHKIPFKKFSTKKLKPLRYIKYGVLLIFVILLPLLVTNSLGMGNPFFCKYLCPQGVLEGAIPLSIANASIRAALGKLFTWKFGILITFVILSLMFYRPFCKWICPLGAIYALCNKVSFLQMKVDEDKCVSCGQCLVSCPFSAIVDKGQIFQTIMALKSETPVYAIVAPAIAGQFPGMENNKIRGAFQALGFTDVREVAVGADLCTVEEAKDFLEEVPEKLPFMATSCCPSWSMMAKKLFPEQAKCISMALTPMVLTARLIKQKEPDCKIVFVGPCAAKKLEASRKSIRSYVDFVLTFEEVAGMFDAKGVDWKDIPEGEPLFHASADGRGFAVSGGVAEAVVHAVKRIDPDREVKVMNAEGLQNCKKMLQMAKIGKYNGYLLEGMACPGGCVAGAGTIQTVKKAAAALEKMKKEASFTDAYDSKYRARLESLEKFDVE